MEIWKSSYSKHFGLPDDTTLLGLWSLSIVHCYKNNTGFQKLHLFPSSSERKRRSCI